MRIIALAIVAILRLSPVSSSAALQDLPDGSGKETTVKVCGTCHEPARVAALRQSRQMWQDTIERMANFSDANNAMKATEEELKTILDYLTTNFGPPPPRPLNVNKATAVELESVLGLLRKESAAIIQYRTDKGDFKSIEDVKKVPGVDPKKIEAKRDRLVF